MALLDFLARTKPLSERFNLEDNPELHNSVSVGDVVILRDECPQVAGYTFKSTDVRLFRRWKKATAMKRLQEVIKIAQLAEEMYNELRVGVYEVAKGPYGLRALKVLWEPSVPVPEKPKEEPGRDLGDPLTRLVSDVEFTSRHKRDHLTETSLLEFVEQLCVVAKDLQARVVELERETKEQRRKNEELESDVRRLARG